MTKAELRLVLTRELRALTAAKPLREAASQAICGAIRQQHAWRNARLVCAFLPFASEPQIASLWEQNAGRVFCFPRVNDHNVMLIQPDDLAAASRAGWKLASPEFEQAPPVPPPSIDLFLVPGVAFTRDGRRLGRGMGYYDRLLAQRSPDSIALGVCFALQLVADLPEAPHDQRVDLVVTEETSSTPEDPPPTRDAAG